MEERRHLRWLEGQRERVAGDASAKPRDRSSTVASDSAAKRSAISCDTRLAMPRDLSGRTHGGNPEALAHTGRARDPDTRAAGSSGTGLLFRADARGIGAAF